jgi:hypothetical protein
MLKKHILFIVSLLCCLLPLKSIAKNDTLEKTDFLAQRFFISMAKSAFEDTAAQFHYPLHYTPSERSKDITAVSHMLKVMQKEFGLLLTHKLLEKEYRYYAVTASGGDVPYWQQHPYFLERVYQVTFSKDGSGYVIIRFCKITEVWEIQSVGYGLPAERAGAKKRITDILKTLSVEMKPFMEEREEQKNKVI